jgi:hypothetical protein
VGSKQISEAIKACLDETLTISLPQKIAMPLLYSHIFIKSRRQLELLSAVIFQYPERGHWIHWLQLERFFDTETLHAMMCILGNTCSLKHLGLLGDWIYPGELQLLRQLHNSQLESLTISNTVLITDDDPVVPYAPVAAILEFVSSCPLIFRLEIVICDMDFGEQMRPCLTSVHLLRILIIDCGWWGLPIFRLLGGICFTSLQEFSLRCRRDVADENFQYVRDFFLTNAHIKELTLEDSSETFHRVLFGEPRLICAPKLQLSSSDQPLFTEDVPLPESIRHLSIIKNQLSDERLWALLDGVFCHSSGSLATICLPFIEWCNLNNTSRDLFESKHAGRLMFETLRFKEKGVSVVDTNGCSLTCL